MTTWTIGVDPGLSGAVAILDDAGRLVEVIDMPQADGHVNGAALRGAIDACRWELTPYPLERVHVVAWVEDVHAMPGQGVSSTFKFGRSVGVVVGVLGALDIPIRWVAPGVWKKSMGLPTGKNVTKRQAKEAARRRAMELWPDKASLFTRAKDDGRAEAALIAWYGRGKA